MSGYIHGAYGAGGGAPRQGVGRQRGLPSPSAYGRRGGAVGGGARVAAAPRAVHARARGGARKPPGRQIEEDYKFVKRIGGGSFGDVYLAEDRKHPGVKVRWGGRLGV